MSKIGFIGCGNMGGALAKAVSLAGNAEKIFLADLNTQKAEDLAKEISATVSDAKEIAADIISNGYFDDYTLLTDEQKKQVEFVQFHPSYDYSDFVEGLRPKVNADGTMGFELQDGIFKKFVTRAKKNYEDSQKSRETVEKELSVQESMTEFFASVELGVDTFKTINGNEFTIISVDDSHINISRSVCQLHALGRAGLFDCKITGG